VKETDQNLAKNPQKSCEDSAGFSQKSSRKNDTTEWLVPVPRVTVCTHKPDGTLCHKCRYVLDCLLADVPQLLRELRTVFIRDVCYPKAGWRRGSHLDLTRLIWSEPAARVLNILTEHMHTYRDELSVERLRRLSAIFELAHRVIDRPLAPITVWCIRCGRELALGPGQSGVSCDCGYTATRQQYQADVINANQDMLLTSKEVSIVLTSAGEPISRQTVERMAVRCGLPREKITVPRWQNGRIVQYSTWGYRVADVQALAARHADNEHIHNKTDRWAVV
jgi:hypothetical protein